MDEFSQEDPVVENDEKVGIIRGTRKHLKINEKREIKNEGLAKIMEGESSKENDGHGAGFLKTKTKSGSNANKAHGTKSALKSVTKGVSGFGIEETHEPPEIQDGHNQVKHDKLSKNISRRFTIVELPSLGKLNFGVPAKHVKVNAEISNNPSAEKLSIESEFQTHKTKRTMKSRVLASKHKFNINHLLRKRRNAISGIEGFGVPNKEDSKRLLNIFENPKSTTSDTEELGWSSSEHYKDELDEEWLGIEKEYRSNRTYSDADISKPEYLSSKPNIDHNIEFMESMKYFWWTLMIGGRMPFQTFTEDRITKFRLNKYSFSFVYFAISSVFLTFCTTTMGYSFLRISWSQRGNVLNNYERIERLEVDKYWHYAFATLIASVLASSSSLATIFDDGYILADFLTRWNLAISVMKYRPTTGIRCYFWINACMFVIYAAIIVLLFNTEEVPVVKGAAGLIGLTICYPFSYQIRYSRNYPLIEKLGLFVHLYVTYSFRTFLLMVMLYCKALVNMSRKWNHRLSYVLGILGRAFNHNNIVSVISYKKLFVEHTIIIGILRHTGRVFAVTLGIFYTLKMIELLILIYRVMSVIVYPLLSFNATYVEGIPDNVAPITYTDPPHVLIGASVVVLLHSAAEWLTISGQISSCGDTILNGYSFIRRFGLILSKTSARRRFVQSLNHAFSSSTEYYIKAGFTINRQFIFNTFFWLAVFSALLTSFHPFRLEKDLITVCSANGNCVTISRSRIKWNTQEKPGIVELKNFLDNDKLTTLIQSIKSTTTTPTTTTTPNITTTSTTTSTPTTTMPTTTATTSTTITTPTTTLSTTTPSTTTTPTTTVTTPTITTTTTPTTTTTRPTTTTTRPTTTTTRPTTTTTRPTTTTTRPTTTTTRPTTTTTRPTTTTTRPTTTRTRPTTTTTRPTTTRTRPTTTTTRPTTTRTRPTTTRTRPTTTTTRPTTTRTRPTTTTTRPTTTTKPPPPRTRQCDRFGEPSWKTEIPNVCRPGDTVVLPYSDRDCLRGKDEIPFDNDLSTDYYTCGDRPARTVNLTRRDDCQNIDLVNKNGNRSRIVATRIEPHAGRKKEPYILCCYDYGFNSEQLTHCNQDHPENLDSDNICKAPRRDKPNEKNKAVVPPYYVKELNDKDSLQDCFPKSQETPTLTPKCNFNINRCFCGTNPTAKLEDVNKPLFPPFSLLQTQTPRMRITC